MAVGPWSPMELEAPGDSSQVPPQPSDLVAINMSMTQFHNRLERMTGVLAPREAAEAGEHRGANALEKIAKGREVEVKLDPQEVEISEHWFWLDSAKAKRLIGYRPRDTYETMHDTISARASEVTGESSARLKGQLHELRSR